MSKAADCNDAQSRKQCECIDIRGFLHFDLRPKHKNRSCWVEDEAFEDVHIERQAIVPQVEAFASRHNIELNKGWKVEVAKGVKQQLLKAKADIIPDAYISKWEALFNKFNL